MNSPSQVYPAFFDDAATKTAGLASQLYRRAAPTLLRGFRSLAGPDISTRDLGFVRRLAAPVGNTVVGTVGGGMLDRVTGGDGTVGSLIGGGLGASSFGMARGGAGRLFNRLAPRVLGLKALDMAQRSRMGYSTLDPNSVKIHMQDQMAQELEPIISPWRGMQPPAQPQSSAALIAKMQGAMTPPKPKIPGFFG